MGIQIWSWVTDVSWMCNMVLRKGGRYDGEIGRYVTRYQCTSQHCRYLGQGNHSLALAASHDFASSSSSGSCAVVPTVWDWDGDGMKEVIVGDQAGKFNLCRLINGRLAQAMPSNVVGPIGGLGAGS